MALNKQRHASPDGLLHLVVDTCVTENKEHPNGFEDWLIGIEPGGWHTHPDILANVYDTTQQEATERYVDQILNDQQVIALRFVSENLHDAFVVDLVYSSMEEVMESEKKYIEQNERMIFRYWSGKQVAEINPAQS